jgi:murein DD-endopeptidase / murein LD-carboxypeptidase
MTLVLDAGRIAERAISQIDTPFRHYGRTPHVALDCVGLTLFAIGSDDCKWQYSLKGDYVTTISAHLENSGFVRCDAMRARLPGEIALARCAPRNQHLMIRSHDGWVHAHAGLGRVVHMPGDSPWPLIAHWRLAGE